MDRPAEPALVIGNRAGELGYAVEALSPVVGVDAPAMDEQYREPATFLAVIDASTYEAVAHAYPDAERQQLMLKGKRMPVDVFRIPP